MPRKNPVPPEEISICQRLRAWRETLSLPQSYVAKLMGVDRAYLAGVESGRAPVQYRHVFPLLNIRALNAHWLMTGTRSEKPDKIAIPHPDSLGDKRLLFSEVYSAHLFDAESEIHFPGGTIGREIARSWIEELAFQWVAEVKDSALDSFVNDLDRAAEKLLLGRRSPQEEVAKRLPRLEELRRFGQARKAMLQNSNLQDNAKALISSPLNRLDSLIARVNNATQSHGAKSDLARFLGVPPQRVREWLSGAKSPGGETTLRLLEWVTAEEAKQNAPAGATNTREGQQTRNKKHANESKSGPPRRR